MGLGVGVLHRVALRSFDYSGLRLSGEGELSPLSYCEEALCVGVGFLGGFLFLHILCFYYSITVVPSFPPPHCSALPIHPVVHYHGSSGPSIRVP